MRRRTIRGSVVANLLRGGSPRRGAFGERSVSKDRDHRVDRGRFRRVVVEVVRDERDVSLARRRSAGIHVTGVILPKGSL
jgi:hypothetical protein